MKFSKPIVPLLPGPVLAFKECGPELELRNSEATTLWPSDVAPPDPVPVSGRGGQAIIPILQLRSEAELT